jgi:hypothetical protein
MVVCAYQILAGTAQYASSENPSSSLHLMLMSSKTTVYSGTPAPLSRGIPRTWMQLGCSLA